MKETLISVIVPIYKVEKYLEKCVKSIQAQTYSNLEIILVDDGSPDRCGEMCDRMAEEDERVKVIHKKNGGLSDARNAGIEVAQGEYYVFVDSDDYIHPRMIEILFGGIEKNKAMLSVCGVAPVNEGDTIAYCDIVDIEWNVMVNDSEKLEYVLGEHTTTTFTVAWNKMYHKSLFSEIRYPFGMIHEDEFTTYKIIHLSSKIAYTKVPLYYYVQRTGSIMSNDFDERNLAVLDAYGERLQLYSNKKMFDWYEKVLFLYRLFLMKFRTKIDISIKYDNSILLKYDKIYRREVIHNFHKLPIDGKKKVGYMYSALFPDNYYKNRYESK